MSGEHPAPRTTLVRGNDRHVSAGISLGELVHIHKYASWHNTEHLFAIRFRHGSMDMDEMALREFIEQGQAALAMLLPGPELSGSCADLGESA